MNDTGGVEADGVDVVDEPDHSSRRTAIKTGGKVAGVAVAAWAIPTISGVGITPADAHVACSPVTKQNLLNNNPFPPAGATVSWSFNVNSNSGGCSDPADWTGTANTHQINVSGGGYNVNVPVTATGPSGNVDNPCFQTVAQVTAAPASFVVTQNLSDGATVCVTRSKTYTLNCAVTRMQVNSCPPAGIANSNACGRTGAGGCSAALNGSASGAVTVVCTYS